MNRLNAEEAKKILEAIEEGQPELALGIRNLMFTFEDLITVPPATIARSSPASKSGNWRWPSAGPMKTCARRSSRP